MFGCKEYIMKYFYLFIYILFILFTSIYIYLKGVSLKQSMQKGITIYENKYEDLPMFSTLNTEVNGILVEIFINYFCSNI